MAIIELSNLTKNFGSKKVINDFSLKIEDGESIAIIGSSGSGKTTILNIIGLLEKFDEGTLTIDGESNIKVNSHKATKVLREKISYLFQNFALVDEETVYYNLNIALRYVKGNKKDRQALMQDALKTVGLEGYEKNKVFELSGGEQQRVAIARILLKPSKIVLADEPTGSLDEDNVKKVLSSLQLLKEKGKTIIVVTHDKIVANSCDRIITI